MFEFEAVLLQHESMDAAYIEFPYDVEAEFGTKGQVKVHALIDGAEYRGSLARMGLPCHCLGVTQAVRKQIAKQPGDRVKVRLWKDEEPRTVEVPDDVQRLLEAEGLAEAFNRLSYTKQKEYMTGVVESKRPETREKRIVRLLEAVRGSMG